MQEIKITSPEEQKISYARGLYDDDDDDDDVLNLTEENEMLRNNVKELQHQLQNAYKRIKELNLNTNQMELF